ncbi:hypothetical protein SSAG_00284 [Streptomyces sp. Mg1]|nr:hypothetical protein SSAG_00284 [Streptomyces sp. Mg1]
MSHGDCDGAGDAAVGAGLERVVEVGEGSFWSLARRTLRCPVVGMV